MKSPESAKKFRTFRNSKISFPQTTLWGAPNFKNKLMLKQNALMALQVSSKRKPNQSKVWTKKKSKRLKKNYRPAMNLTVKAPKAKPCEMTLIERERVRTTNAPSPQQLMNSTVAMVLGTSLDMVRLGTLFHKQPA